MDNKTFFLWEFDCIWHWNLLVKSLNFAGALNYLSVTLPRVKKKREEKKNKCNIIGGTFTNYLNSKYKFSLKYARLEMKYVKLSTKNEICRIL